MKDATHHLKQLQKKVIRSAKKAQNEELSVNVTEQNSSKYSKENHSGKKFNQF